MTEALDVLAVVVPLAEGQLDRVRALVAEGPPFDPDAVGLARHEVFLGEGEAVFVFEAPGGSGLERLVEDPAVWSAAAGWHELVAGPPRAARLAFTWEAQEDDPGLFFDPTPGPGDSEGGDYYAPE
jgi:hypothetical protein